MSVPLLGVLSRKNLRLGNTTHSLLNNFHPTHEECQYCNARLQSFSYRGSVNATLRTLV